MNERRPETARIARLRLIMRERGIAALLVTQRENVRYLTGFTGSAGSLLLARGRPVLITDFRYQSQAAAESPGTKLLIQKKDHASAIKAAADRLGIPTLWFDESSFTLDRLRALRKQGLRLIGAKDPVAETRLRKDAAELRHMKLAIRRAEHSFLELLPGVRAGTTEQELALRLEMLMRGRGARRAAFDTIVASGRNGAMPHASVSGRRLRDGDLVTFDFGAEANGYFCDITRTVCVGRPSARQREIHDLVRRAQQKAIETVGPGVRCADVDRAAREIIDTAGHGAHFGHATGHGIGLMVHEGPGVSALSKQRLATGMVITVEPGVYVPGWGGVRIEDMVLVTDDGYQMLTGLPRGL
ncbi:MAG: M24 family metallopeptidase [Nitrospirota bacterium]